MKGWLQHGLYTRPTWVLDEKLETVVLLMLLLIPISHTWLRPPCGVCRILIWNLHCWGDRMGSWELCGGPPEVSGRAAPKYKQLRILSSQDGELQLKKLSFIWDSDCLFLLSVLPADFLILEFTLATPLIPHTVAPPYPTMTLLQHLTPYPELVTETHQSLSAPQPGSLSRAMCNGPSNRLRQIHRTSKAEATQAVIL